MPGEPHRIGRYEVKRELGHGAMGVVYLAFDPLLKRLLAVKTVREFGPDAESTLVRFQREAEISARLNHPNIVTVHDVGEDPQAGPFLAMEFVDGLPLSDLIRQGLPPESTLDLLLQGASALQAAERAGIVHRDVKPANILVSHDGRLKLMDFGIARSEGTRLTQTGQIMGTPSYTAPEALAGAEPSCVTDHYAFAVTAFQMLSGMLPFECATIAATLFRIVHDPPLFPDSMPEAQRRVFERALAKEPADRYPNLLAFMRDLVVALELPAELQARFLADLADGSGLELAHLVQSQVEEAATLSRMATQPTAMPVQPMDTRELATEALRTPWPDAGVPRPSGVPVPIRGARPAPASRPGQVTRPSLASQPSPSARPDADLPSRATQPGLDADAPSRATQPGAYAVSPGGNPPPSLATQMFPSLPARVLGGSQSTQPMPAGEAPEAQAAQAALDAPAPQEDPEPQPPVEAGTGLEPADGSVPADGAVPADGSVPVDGAVPVDGSVPVDGAVPVDRPTAPRRAHAWMAACLVAAVVLGGALWTRRSRTHRPAALPAAALASLPVPAPAAASAAAPEPFAVQVLSEPPGAEVLLDGVAQGRTPLRGLQVPGAGPRNLVLRLAGHAEWSRTLEPGQPLPGLIRLEPAAAGWSIITRPAGAEAFLNGRRVGVTPLQKLASPSAGAQRLELRLKNYQVWEGELRAGSEPPVITLAPLLAHLKVRTEPAGGAVFLDGKPVGVAPLEHLAVAMTGTHTVRISRPGYEDWSASLDPARGLPDPIVLVQVRKGQGPGQGPAAGSAPVPARSWGEQYPSWVGTQERAGTAAHPAAPPRAPEPREGRH